MSIEDESPSALASLSESPVEEQGFASLPNESVSTTTTTEIDVREVVESFRDSKIAVTDERGFDRIVRWVTRDEAALVTMQACPVCGCCQGQPVYAMEGLPFRVVICTTCQTGQLHPRATPEQIRAFYPPEYYGTTGAKFEPIVEAFVKIVGARHVRSLTRGIPEGGKVLDVGCGRGVVLGALADREFEVHGFEISQTAAEGADHRTQIRIADDLTEARYLTDCFDQVILWHVLEHLPNPRETLEEIHRILKPGGRLSVAVPNFTSLQAGWAGPAWFHLDLPRHLYHFTLPSLKQLLRDCGFQCRKEHHFSLRQNPFGWVQSAFNRIPNMPRNGLYSLLKRQAESKNGMFDSSVLWKLQLGKWLGMPLGAAVSIFAALVRSGASVSIVAEADKTNVER